MVSEHRSPPGPPAPAAEKQVAIREIIFQIRRLMQAGSLYSKELNKKHQVSAAQLNCLLALYENGPLSSSQIARHIFVKPSTVTGIIDRLEQKGLARRTRQSTDRRVITIELTEFGERLAENAPPPIQQKIMDGLRRLSADETETILHGLQRLTQMLDVQDLEVE
ncbi:MAG: MarR family transcriptional regulator [Deltaproteobacteria bacterium]|nr:MarR family transcriptional regulator [Deltaproteobacteria bacterium]